MKQINRNKINVKINVFICLGESENGMSLEKTFSNDEQLPALPLPELHDTLSLYLDSVKPHLTNEEFLNTKQIVDNFEKNEGIILHQRLADRAKDRKNWVNLTINSSIYFCI